MEYRIPIPRMTDNIVVMGNYIYLNGGMKRVYMYRANEPAMGKGGMGVVYRGYDCRTGDKVAIKRLYDRYCSMPSIRRKARIESGLVFSHPNIVEMLGYSEFRCGRGPIFVISSFVEGWNVDKFIDMQASLFSGEGRAAKIVRLLLPILDALYFLHNQYIYHLDIKPSNIMIDRFSTARLMDLGVANSSLDGAEFGQDEFGVVGTPRFAAPEQFRIPGRPSAIDRTSDLYEMAVTLYELITGDKPFEGSTLKETATKHFHEELPEHPDVPDRLMAVLKRATEVAIPNRYATAIDFKSALLEALATPAKQRQGLFRRSK